MGGKVFEPLIVGSIQLGRDFLKGFQSIFGWILGGLAPGGGFVVG